MQWLLDMCNHCAYMRGEAQAERTNQMTRIGAKLALENHTRVAGGEPGTQDYDEGYIVSIGEGGLVAMVAWDSGVRTPTPIDDLSPLN